MSDRRLVVNADDFGLSEGVNRGIVRAHVEGIVTTASLMVDAPVAREAVEAASAHPELALGLHVDLGEWSCAPDGTWRELYARVDTDDEAAVEEELTRQVERFQVLTGRMPTHMDSHQHVHRTEPVRSAMGRLAKALRVPLRHHSRVRYCGDFYGRSGNGPLAQAIEVDALVRLILDLPDGATELCCHPAEVAEAGWDYGPERCVELESLCHARVRAAVERAGVRLCTFRAALAAPSAG